MERTIAPLERVGTKRANFFGNRKVSTHCEFQRHNGDHFSGVAGGGVCVVSEEGRGSGGCAPGKFFSFSSQNNGVL